MYKELLVAQKCEDLRSFLRNTKEYKSAGR